MSALSFQRFRLPFVLPSFNDMEAAARRRRRGGGNDYAEMKRTFQALIVGQIVKAKLRPVAAGVAVLFHWIERDHRRDPLDVRAGAKFVMDALCGADRRGDTQARSGIIHCDGHHCIVVSGVRDRWSINPNNPGVAVTLYGEVLP